MLEGIWRRVDLDLSDKDKGKKCVGAYVDEVFFPSSIASETPEALYDFFENMLHVRAEEKWEDAILHAFQFDMRTYSWMLLIEPQRFVVEEPCLHSDPRAIGGKRSLLPVYEIISRPRTGSSNGTF